MILVTRLDGTTVVVNSDLIATMEETPDTLLTLSNGHRMIVQEPVEELVERIVAFRRRIFVELPRLRSRDEGEEQ